MSSNVIIAQISSCICFVRSMTSHTSLPLDSKTDSPSRCRSFFSVFVSNGTSSDQLTWMLFSTLQMQVRLFGSSTVSNGSSTANRFIHGNWNATFRCFNTLYSRGKVHPSWETFCNRLLRQKKHDDIIDLACYFSRLGVSLVGSDLRVAAESLLRKDPLECLTICPRKKTLM